MLNMAPQAPDGESLGSLQPNIEPVFKLDREDTKDEEPNLLLLRIIDCKQLRWVTLAIHNGILSFFYSSMAYLHATVLPTRLRMVGRPIRGWVSCLPFPEWKWCAGRILDQISCHLGQGLDGRQRSRHVASEKGKGHHDCETGARDRISLGPTS